MNDSYAKQIADLFDPPQHCVEPPQIGFGYLTITWTDVIESLFGWL